jgi:translation initiation factor IF-2
MEGKKIRVHELAKEIGVEAKKVLIPLLREMGIPNATVMNTLEPADIKKIKKLLEEKRNKEKTGVEVVETQVKEGVIRRRKVVHKVEEEKAPEPEPEKLEEEPSKKKKVLKKKPAKLAKTEETEKVEKVSEAEPAPAPAEPAPAEVKAPVVEEPSPEAKKPSGIGILKEAKEVVYKKPKIKARWTKPTIRRTARATGEIPTMEASAAEEKLAGHPGKPAEKEKPKDKKKKGGKVKPELETFTDKSDKSKKPKEAVKRKLRRKIAFKMERGALEEGLEIAGVERIYTPQKKKPTAKKRPAQKPQITVPKQGKRVIHMAESIEVRELARRMGLKSGLVMEKLAGLELQAGEGDFLNFEEAALVCREFGFEVVQELFDEAKIIQFPKSPLEEGLEPRPPVVTVMGHVDHGKTTLLDYIRKTKVADKEPGQITQSIGASVVETPSGKITFIDTPGHAAFTQMRARGSQITDIVVLVVAADDGVMPQTLEAINHAQAAKVPIVVAINKMDLPGVNPDRIKSRLAELGLTPEEWGGQTLMVPCSARTGLGVDDLLEHILLQAEILNLHANPKLPARGFVIESKLEKGRGTVASIVVREGTLRLKDPVVCGSYSGKVRALFDHLGRQLQEAGPSMPVEVIGIDGVPDAGEEMIVVKDERDAREVAGHRAEKKRADGLTGSSETSLDDLLKKMEQGIKAELNVIIKADTQGGVEAVRDSILKMSTDKVEIRILHVGSGAITENDVLLAEASKAVIIGFAVRPETKASRMAEEKGIRIYTHRIIYELLDEIDSILKGMVEPVKKEKVLGRAEVRQVFQVSKVGAIAGSFVQEGVVNRTAQVRLLRDNTVVYEGKISSLKRFKDDAREVAAGYECGIGIENFNDLKPGDVLEFFVMEIAGAGNERK